MVKSLYTTQQIADISRHVIHLFLDKKMDEFMSYLDDDFVWVGDYESLFTRGKENFAAVTATEAELPPVTISMEEYNVLLKVGFLCVVYGRCTVTSEMPQLSPTPLSTNFHFTFVWSYASGLPRLKEAMACHTQDALQPDKVMQAQVFSETLRYQKAAAQDQDDEKLSFYSISEKGQVYLYPSEIQYISAANTNVILHTAQKEIQVNSTIQNLERPPFVKISRSYLANPAYVHKFNNYKLHLIDGTVLPVSRRIYSELKRSLGKQIS